VPGHLKALAVSASKTIPSGQPKPTPPKPPPPTVSSTTRLEGPPVDTPERVAVPGHDHVANMITHSRQYPSSSRRHRFHTSPDATSGSETGDSMPPGGDDIAGINLRAQRAVLVIEARRMKEPPGDS